MLTISFDNNPTGAIAVVEFNPSESPRVELLITMPTISVGKNVYIDETTIFNLINKYKKENENILVAFEIGQRQPLFGTKGNFANGFSYGVIRTLVRLSELPHIEVNPKTWQKEIFKDIRGADMSTKEASIEYCKRRFPNETLLPTPRCSKKHDGLADALCIASYAARL